MIARWYATVPPCVAIAAAIMVSCSRAPTQTAGSGSRGGNPVVIGRMVQPDSTAASEVPVWLVPKQWCVLADTNLPLHHIDTTDTDGFYEFTAVDTGGYNIQAVSPARGLRALVSNIVVAADTVVAIEGILKTPGTVIIDVTDSSSGIRGYLPGAITPPSRLTTDSNGTFLVLDSVPEGGDYIVMGYDPRAGKPTVPLSVAASVMESDTFRAVFHLAGWPFGMPLRLNTTSAGAAVDADIDNFPVVIRLAGTFPFSQALGDGKDLRCVNARGEILPIEIERWDSLEQRAIVWIRVDTVRGNAVTRLGLYWGNHTASGGSPSAFVFDTAQGFAGVWHLDEEMTGRGHSGVYLDATQNRAHGVDIITADGKNGVIGRGQEFGGAESRDWIRLGTNHGFTRSLSAITLEAWIWADSAPRSRCIVGHSVWDSTMEDSSRAMLFTSQEGAPAIAGRPTAGEGGAELIGGTPLTPGSWHHVAGVIDYAGDSIALFVDGRHIQTLAHDFAAEMTAYSHSRNNTIGAFYSGTSRFFDGYIDEVRTHRVARGPAWIRLCHENQKTDQTLVKWPEK